MTKRGKNGCFVEKHGKTGTPEYVAWMRMRVRCSDPKNQSFYRYGGRGIKVCERWQDFEVFLSDLGLRPSPDHSLDRIDNNGDYEPGNVRWATIHQQQNNRSRTIRICYMGVDRPLSEWAEITGQRYGTMEKRFRRGWPPEEIICGRI